MNSKGILVLLTLVFAVVAFSTSFVTAEQLCTDSDGFDLGTKGITTYCELIEGTTNRCEPYSYEYNSDVCTSGGLIFEFVCCSDDLPPEVLAVTNCHSVPDKLARVGVNCIANGYSGCSIGACVGASYPDLEILDFEIIRLSGSKPKPFIWIDDKRALFIGEQLHISAIVGNDDDTGASDVELELKVEVGSSVILENGKEDIGPHKESDYGGMTIPMDATVSGTYVVSASVDPKNKIQEDDETNNYKEYSIIVLPTNFCLADEECGEYQICSAEERYVCASGCREEVECSGFNIDTGLGFCSEDQCVECLNTLDCSDNQICDSSGMCVGTCRETSQCPEGKVCRKPVVYSNPITSREAKFCLSGCESNSDCSSGYACELDTSTCIDYCFENTDCQNGYVCESPYCVEAECTQNSDCSSDSVCTKNYLYDKTGQCTEGSCSPHTGGLQGGFSEPNSCGSGYECEQESGVSVNEISCEVDLDENETYCNNVFGKSYAIRINNTNGCGLNQNIEFDFQYGGSYIWKEYREEEGLLLGESMEITSYVTLSMTAPCSEPDKVYATFRKPSASSVSYSCSSSCTSDDNCQNGYICSDSSCMSGCREDDFCPDGYVCDVGTEQCLTSCDSDEQCYGDYECTGEGTCLPPLIGVGPGGVGPGGYFFAAQGGMSTATWIILGVLVVGGFVLYSRKSKSVSKRRRRKR